MFEPIEYIWPMNNMCLDDVKAFLPTKAYWNFFKKQLLSHNHFNRPIEIVFNDLHPQNMLDGVCVGGDALEQF